MISLKFALSFMGLKARLCLQIGKLGKCLGVYGRNQFLIIEYSGRGKEIRGICYSVDPSRRYLFFSRRCYIICYLSLCFSSVSLYPLVALLAK